jgi:hypothetical protein
MRNMLFALSAAGALIATPAAAQVYGDAYVAPRTYVAPDTYVAPAPRIVVRPRTVVTEPLVETQVYLAPRATYPVPGQAYPDAPIYINGQRYYRDCWWDWGQRKCELKPWW